MLELRKALDLIGPGQRRRFLLVAALMVVTAVFQTGGVVSIMPFVGVVADPSIVHRHVWVARAYELSGAGSTRQFLIILGAATVLLLAIANAVAALSRWMTIRFVWDVHRGLSERLFRRYLLEPYSFYLNRHSAELQKNVLGDVGWVGESILLPGADVLAKGMVVAAVVLLLVAVDPMLALFSAGTLSSAYAAIHLLIRQKQRQLGIDRHNSNADKYLITGEAFGGIKDAKALESEFYFLARFSEASRRYARVTTAHAIIGELPRYLLETVAFGGVVVTIIYLLNTRDTLTDVLPLLALYALAGYRLIPALQSVFGSLNVIRFYSPVLRSVHGDVFREPPPESDGLTWLEAAPSAGQDQRMALSREIRIHDVTFTYPGSAKPSLVAVNLVIPAKRTIGIVGSTGSGKTTVVDLLLGLFRPAKGDVLIDGVALRPELVRAWRRRIGYVSQAIFLTDATIEQNIAFGVDLERIDRDAVVKAARAAHLDEFVKSLPHGYATVVGERGVRLSGGERQRVAIARALYRNPDVLLLDEATSALDGATEEAVMEAIRELSGRKTIVLVAHRLSTLRDCDIIYMLEEGSIGATGSFAELADGNVAFRAMAGAFATLKA